MLIFSLALTLFLLMDAIGNVPIYVSLLKEIPQKRQRAIIIRELLMALAIIVAFYFIGNYLLELLKVSVPAVLISGGIILFVIGLKLVFPPEKKEVKLKKNEEPFLVPLAVPLVSGPAVLAAVILYSHQDIPTWIVLGAIFIAWAITTLILLLSPLLQRVLKERGLTACERFTGLILIMLAVQMFLNGIESVLYK